VVCVGGSSAVMRTAGGVLELTGERIVVTGLLVKQGGSASEVQSHYRKRVSFSRRRTGGAAMGGKDKKKEAGLA